MKERTKSGLYREEPLKKGSQPLGGKFRVGGRVCQVGSEGCWENLEARYSFICKICTSVPCPWSETKNPGLCMGSEQKIGPHPAESQAQKDKAEPCARATFARLFIGLGLMGEHSTG